jgi:hypothetical protein
MKISEMIVNLVEVLEKWGDLDVVYSSDEEGNSFHKVAYTPSVGFFKDNEFDSTEEGDEETNAVCIN